jgi:phospholipid/cholesterol/gamma-HCH transport system substrate-binding protein
MKTTGTQKLKTGIFVIAALGVLAITIYLIGRQKSLFTNTFAVYANFKNVSGLQVGNFVRFAGINVGTVQDITIKNDTTVRVNLLLQTRVKPYIKSDSKVSIASDGLMGDKLIQIAPGSDSSTPLKDGQLTAVNPMDMDRLMNKLAIIADNAQVITNNLGEITGKINGGKGSLGKLLNSDDFERNINATVQSANTTVQNIGKAAAGASDNMEAAKHSILFRGYFKKKEKQRIQDSIKAAKRVADSTANVKGKKKN